MTHSFRHMLFILTAGLLTACSSTPKDVKETDQLPVIYPDYIGVTIPVGVAPLNFAMQNDSVETIDVEIIGSKGGSLHANGSYADFDIDDWHELLETNRGGELTLTVCALQQGQWVRYRSFKIHVSTEELKAWGITYRLIPPSYEIYSKMGLYQRELSTFDEKPMLINTQVPGACINCHTANRGNPDQYVFHIRGQHGATAIYRDKRNGKGNPELLKASNDSLGGSMVYPYWHPSGRYCAFTTNKTSQLFHTRNPKRIEVYDASSDVFIYDAETHTILKDTITMRKLWAENCPAFSPDGRFLYYTTALRQVYPTHYDKERYSLCRVSFDEKTGKLGEQADTLITANAIGKSITWPRPSYDGRYLMFTQADYGYFSIWHPEADLWLMDLQTGATRPLDEVNSPRAESQHNWSPDSHWFLYTSRRDDGLYTRIYLSCLTPDGHATKPFLLPQRNPKEYYRQLLYSYNTPDFTTRPVSLNPRQLGNKIESDERIKTKVKE